MLRKLTDKLRVSLSGGVRIRLFRTAQGLDAEVRGKIPGRWTNQKLLIVVKELANGRPGVIHIRKRGRATWAVHSKGPLAGSAFNQRLQNILTNL